MKVSIFLVLACTFHLGLGRSKQPTCKLDIERCFPKDKGTIQGEDSEKCLINVVSEYKKCIGTDSNGILEHDLRAKISSLKNRARRSTSKRQGKKLFSFTCTCSPRHCDNKEIGSTNERGNHTYGCIEFGMACVKVA